MAVFIEPGSSKIRSVVRTWERREASTEEFFHCLLPCNHCILRGIWPRLFVIHVTYSLVCPPSTLENAVEERKEDMGGHDCESFVNCKVLRLCWKLQSSMWLCDTEIYSIGFQGIDYFHLCHSIPPGLSHLFLWHSLKAWSQKRTFWTMSLLSYSAFADLLNSLLHHSAITPHPTFPDTLFSSNLGIYPCHLPHSTGALHPCVSLHHFWYWLWVLFWHIHMYLIRLSFISA